MDVSGRHPTDWIRDYVLLNAKALLRNEDLSVQQVSDMLAFPNPSFFGKFFKEHVGCTPGEYQNQK
jgi:AraC-like DNA-binding protein